MSRLAGDYRMYYRQSVVGLNTEEGVKPFYVAEVSTDSSIYDPYQAYLDSGGIHRERDDDDDDDDEDDEHEEHSIPESFQYNEQAYASLLFHGTILNSDGNSGRSKVVSLSDLELEPPKAGYVKVGNNYHYLEFRPLRVAKKGITRDRMVGASHVNFSALAAALYYPRPDEIRMNGALLLGDNVMYKGVRIGIKSGNNITIDVAEAEYLRPFLVKEFEDCQIRIVPR